MSIDQTNDHPHRSNLLNMIPIEDYNKLAKELEQASNRIKKLESRNFLYQSFLGYFEYSKATIMIGFWFLVPFMVFILVCLRERAQDREIAEREATSYVSRRYGPVNTSLCSSYGLQQQCFVRLTDPSKSPVIVMCDDDEPESNDGCWVGNR